jgi:Rab-like protein 3
MNSSTIEKAKILIVGDSGVGKSSLMHLIVHHEVLKKTNWTIGCSVDVKLHEFKDGTHQHKTYFIELFDIGGYLWHRSSAKMFYPGVDGEHLRLSVQVIHFILGSFEMGVLLFL